MKRRLEHHAALLYLNTATPGRGQVTAVCVLESGDQLTIKDTVGLGLEDL